MVIKRRRRAPVRQYEPMYLYRFPFTALNLGILALFTVMFAGAVFQFRLPGYIGWIRGLMVVYTATVLLVQYSFIIIEYTSRGYQQVPKISAEMVRAGFDIRLLKLVGVALVLLSAYQAIDHEVLQLLLGLVAFIAFPISLGMITLHRSLPAAFNPLEIWQVLKVIGFSGTTVQYLTIQGLLAFGFYYGTANFYDISPAYIIPGVAFLLVLLLLLYRALGIMFHAHAEELGVHIEFSEEKDREAEEDYARYQYDQVVTRIHELSGVHRYADAHELLDAELRKEGYRNERFFYERLQKLQDPYMSVKAGVGYMGRLLSDGDALRAWQVFDYCYTTMKGDVKPPSGAAALQLAESADTKERCERIFDTLAHFENDFPGHPQAAEALLWRARIACTELGDMRQTRDLLDEIRDRFPEKTRDSKYVATEAVLKLA